jgi:hypothetical protein
MTNSRVRKSFQTDCRTLKNEKKMNLFLFIDNFPDTLWIILLSYYVRGVLPNFYFNQFNDTSMLYFNTPLNPHFDESATTIRKWNCYNEDVIATILQRPFNNDSSTTTVQHQKFNNDRSRTIIWQRQFSNDKSTTTIQLQRKFCKKNSLVFLGCPCWRWTTPARSRSSSFRSDSPIVPEWEEGSTRWPASPGTGRRPGWPACSANKEPSFWA